LAEVKAKLSISQRKRKRRRLFIIIGIIVVLIIALALICGRKGTAETRVTTDKVETGDIVAKVNATGRVKAKAEVNIQAEIYEIISKIPVEEGDTVKKGDLLVRLRQASYQYSVDQARADLKTAKSNLERAKSALEYAEFKYKQEQGLYEKNLGSDEAIISAKDQYTLAKTTSENAAQSVQKAQIALEQALDYYEKTEILSPIDGVVTALNYEVGERTMIASPNVPGAVIMTVSDLSTLEVEVRVDETDIKDLRVGQDADIVIDAFPDTTFKGVVTNVGASALISGSSISEQVTDFLVNVQLLDKYDLIKPNLTAEVDIITGTATDVPKLPIQAIVAVDKLPGEKDSTQNDSIKESTEEKTSDLRDKLYEGVYIYDNGFAKFRQVELGIQDQANIEIKSGLDVGEEVITGPYRALRIIKDSDQVIKE
jgi:HlyD family secretion protein